MIAEAMVDPDIEVENISKKGKVLTFTTQEAMANGYCEGSCHDREAVLLAAGIRSYEVEEQQLSWIETFINFLVNPVVSGILIMMMVGGIYFELQTPGIGFAGLVAVLGAILYFAPHYLQGLAAHWEILLFVVGLILLIIELFAFPGFGFFGISGIVIMVVALVLAMVFNIGFDFHFTSDGAILLHFINVMTALMLGFFISLWLSKKVFMLKTRYGAVALDTELSEGDGFTSVDASMKKLIGAKGVTKTFMRPAGKVEIDGDFYDAISENGVIEPNVSIVVVRFENAQLVVHPHVED